MMKLHKDFTFQNIMMNKLSYVWYILYPMQEEAEIVQTKSRLQALLYISNVAFYGGVSKFI